MSPRLLVLAASLTVVLAASGGCEGLPGGGPSGVPTELPAVPTELPAVPTDLPAVPTELPAVPTELPGTEAAPAPDGGEAAPAPTATAPAPLPSTPTSTSPEPTGSAEPGLADTAADTIDDIPWWVWALLVLLVAGLVAAVVALRRAKAAELRWAARWHELTGEARWLDERVVPAVQDRALDPGTLATRWADGATRFDDLDRRVWVAANEETKPVRVADLNALSAALLRLREAVDTEVSLRTSGLEQPGLPDAAQTVADARDELRRTVRERTR